MRLDEAGSLRTESAPSQGTVFSLSASGKHMALPYAHWTVKVQRNGVFKKQKTQLGFCHTFLFLFLLQLKVFSARRKLARPFWQANGKWEMSHLLASETLQLSYGGEECQKKKKKTHFTSHKEKVPAQDLTAIPRGLATLLSRSLKSLLPPLGQLRWPWTFPGTKIHKRWEGRGANSVLRSIRILPTQDPSTTSPPDFTVCPQASVLPSLGFCKMKMDADDLCIQAHTPQSFSWPSPNYPQRTVNHSLPKYQTPTTTTQPSSPAVWLSFPIDWPRAWNKLPIICIMLHDSSLYTSNHFSICKIHQE